MALPFHLLKDQFHILYQYSIPITFATIEALGVDYSYASK